MNTMQASPNMKKSFEVLTKTSRGWMWRWGKDIISIIIMIMCSVIMPWWQPSTQAPTRTWWRWQCHGMGDGGPHNTWYYGGAIPSILLDIVWLVMVFQDIIWAEVRYWLPLALEDDRLPHPHMGCKGAPWSNSDFNFNILKIVSHSVTVNKQNGIPDVLNSVFNISLRLVQISRKWATGK